MKLSVIFTLFLLVVVPSFGQVYEPKQKVTKKYYLMTINATNWFKAFQHCRYLGMQLVSISSQEENDRIVKQIQDEGHGDKEFWTSATKLNDDKTYYWMGNGELVTYFNWAAGRPDNLLLGGVYENCIHIIHKWAGDGNAYYWNDATCNRDFHFICEQERIEYEYCLNQQPF
ncbi:C-type lectin 37Da-like [Sitodiplosis mosellana]|uniref:C-type lectin 37Da-like n=1 Tax=Sitodiplosis mosellana TaxID=263140 RepID=UPI002444CA34|nr:C-type lectin 37Da-like [Sitodiplosis mosellana]